MQNEPSRQQQQTNHQQLLTRTAAVAPSDWRLYVIDEEKDISNPNTPSTTQTHPFNKNNIINDKTNSEIRISPSALASHYTYNYNYHLKPSSSFSNSNSDTITYAAPDINPSPSSAYRAKRQAAPSLANNFGAPDEVIDFAPSTWVSCGRMLVIVWHVAFLVMTIWSAQTGYGGGWLSFFLLFLFPSLAFCFVRACHRLCRSHSFSLAEDFATADSPGLSPTLVPAVAPAATTSSAYSSSSTAVSTSTGVRASSFHSMPALSSAMMFGPELDLQAMKKSSSNNNNNSDNDGTLSLYSEESVEPHHPMPQQEQATAAAAPAGHQHPREASGTRTGLHPNAPLSHAV